MMKSLIKHQLQIGLVLAGCMATTATASELRPLLSRVQMMAHEYHSEAQWAAVFTELATVREAAARERRWTDLIDAVHLEASVRGLMRGEWETALDLLENTRARFQDQPVQNLRRIYVLMAELHARQGNEQAITDLMQAFRTSPHYDPVQYPWRGGTGPDDPLVVTRPSATGRDSITLSTMERHRVAAQFAPGRPMLDIAGQNERGQPVRLSDYRGQVVLVDFWVPHFVTWQRNLPALRQTRDRYRARGFTVIGVPLIPNIDHARTQARELGADWTQWRVDRRTLSQLGIFGDARNYLVDPQGTIRARDVRGGDLDAWLDVLLP